MKTDLIYAFRNIRKNTTNSLITVFGLSVAIACSLMIYMYIIQEYSYNNFHKNADRIYRINYDLRYVYSLYKEVRLDPEIIGQLKKEIPQIEKCTEYRTSFESELSFNNTLFDPAISYASEDFFDMFSFEFIAGRNVHIFTKPNEIIVTAKFADKLLSKKGDYASLLGKAIYFPLNYEKTPFNIIGVIKDIPQNSTMYFDAVVSGKSGINSNCDNYFGYTSVFYMIRANVNGKDAELRVNQFVKKYYQEKVKSMQNANQLVKTDDAFVPFVIPFKTSHIEGEISTCFEKTISKSLFTILITIGSLILLIACSNYTILSLGQYLQRIDDIGVRKVMGASQGNIFTIFLFEGCMLTFLAFIFGGLLCKIFIPVLGKLGEVEIYHKLIDYQLVDLFVVVMYVAIVVLTSLIPVLVFSKVSPHQMSGKKITVGNKNLLSQMFVSFQYSLSIILIILSIFIVRQSDYLKNKSLNFDSNNVIDINISRIDNNQKNLFKMMLAEHPGVICLTKTSRNLTNNGSSNDFTDKGNGEQINVFRFEVDHDYVSTLGLKLLTGENFTERNENKNDQSAIVNKKLTEALGIEDDPLGKSYTVFGQRITIIGVVADYHFFDLRNKVQPAFLTVNPNIGNTYNHILLRYHPKQLSSVIKHITKCYEKVAPGKAFTYDFWNESLKQRYQAEERWGKIIGYASLIAIIISSLGLFGFTILLINQRVKEIGIRKVNGARAFEIMLSINKSFIGWLTGSLIISFPVAYYLVKMWLDHYANKVDISWWVFIWAGLIAFAIATITVSWQTWKAATRNPVESLRNE